VTIRTLLLSSLLPLALAGLGAVVPSCSSPSDERIGLEAPSESLFPPVADLLAYRCGSLDCHGSAQRNFVIWNCDGLRLSPTAVPGCRDTGGTNTTSTEYDATFRSLVALEPTVMSQVVATQGASMDDLTLVKKARGEESHKGGKLWSAGAPEDECLAQWFAGASTTKASCQAALANEMDAGTL